MLAVAPDTTVHRAEARAAGAPHPSRVRQAAEPRVIEVIARRYAFEPADIDVVEGERVRLLVKSGDGLHGFEIRQFKISKEIPRGAEPVAIEFTANAAGRFPILCSVFCGDGHDDMKGTLVVTARPTGEPPYLTDGQIQIIRRWIANGAARN
jgi:cytochrome c oxidase subunit 2